MLEEVKQRLSITGHDLDPTINGMIDDVVAFCLSAGVKYSQLVKPDVIGLIARGVADLWNYGAGDGKFSQVFHMRLNQLCIAAYSIEGDLLPQSKEVTITDNGTTEITPDEGYLLTGVTVDTAVSGKPEQTKAVTIRENGVTEVMPDAGHVLTGVTVEANVPQPETQEKTIDISTNGTEIVTPDEGLLLSSVTVNTNVPPTPTQSKAVRITDNGTHVITPDPGYTMREVVADVSVSAAGGDYNIALPVLYSNSNGSVIRSITEINLENVVIDSPTRWDGMFRDASMLKMIKWGGLFDGLLPAQTVTGDYMFYNCSKIETIDMSECPDVKLTAVNNMFYSCSKLREINFGRLKISSKNLSYMFAACLKLESLDLSNMDSSIIQSLSGTFNDCSSLTNIIFPANLFPNTGLTSIYLVPCPLSHDCAVDIFNKLATRTNSPTLKLSATTKGYLTENEIAIATGKGWVVS